MRIARRVVPGVLHHVISRFVDRRWELRDDSERAEYLRLLGKSAAATGMRCLAYALMSSHVHLAVVVANDDLGSPLLRIHARFARWMNKRHGRLGPVFAGRAATWAIRPGNEARLIAYIHRNPVRAGVAARATDSTWTSHRAYCALAAPPPWLAVEDGLRRCGVAADAFDDWTSSVGEELDRPDLRGMATMAHRFGALEIATPTDAPLEVPLVMRSFARVRPYPAEVVDAVADIMKLRAAEFCSPRRAANELLVTARQVCVIVARSIGIRTSDICAAMGVSRQTGSTLANRPADELTRARVTVVLATLTARTASLGKGA